MKTQVEEKFSDFYVKWMAQLEDLLQLLLLLVSRGRGPQADDQQAAYEAQLVNKLTAHHKEYYTYKWAAAREDVLAFFSPVWLTPLENTCLWITGWKPSMAFRLVDSMMKVQPPAAAVRGLSLTEEQVKKIRALTVKIKMEEEKVEREMERQQVAVADRKMVELVRLQMRAKKSGDGSVAPVTTQVDGLVEMALKGTLAGLERVMKMADCARLKTLKGLLEILNPMQSVHFLASKSMLQIRMGKWGRIREQKCHNNDHDDKEIKICRCN